MESSNTNLKLMIRSGLSLVLAVWAASATAFPIAGFGGEVDTFCADQGYPLDPQFEPQVGGNCFACHDNGNGGSGAGETAYSSGDFEFFCPPVASNLPPVADANGPYAGEVDQPISFSSAGSVDDDGMIVEYLWDFGDGMTSGDPNPTHAYAGAADYSVSLTVTDDMGDSDTSTAGATVTQPAVNEPDIHLDPAALNFNQIETGTTTTLAATLENTGTQVLSISSLMACAGTSGEYNWSPSSLEIQPGGSAALSVMYSPTDELLDEGCLEIMSNDPDESVIELGLSGVGYVPAPVMADLDITRFAARKRARVGQNRPIDVRLVLSNTGLDQATVDVMLTATQNGVVVHEEQISTDALPGEQTQVAFSQFVPTEAGDIEWHVSILDEDPDIDEATSMTHVVAGKPRRIGRRERD